MEQLWRKLTCDQSGALRWPVRIAILGFFAAVGFWAARRLYLHIGIADGLMGKDILVSALTVGTFTFVHGVGVWLIRTLDLKKQFRDTYRQQNEVIFSNACNLLLQMGNQQPKAFALKELIRLRDEGAIDSERVENSIKNSDLSETSLVGMDLQKENLTRVSFVYAHLMDADLSGADLSHASLWNAKLSGANLAGADLSGAALDKTDLSDTVLDGAVLKDATLKNANLSHKKLPGADLSGANLEGANLFSAELAGADLSGANLEGANLFYADLSGANLKNAKLEKANLEGAKIAGADLSGAALTQTNLKRVDWVSEEKPMPVLDGIQFNPDNPPQTTDTELEKVLNDNNRWES